MSADASHTASRRGQDHELLRSFAQRIDRTDAGAQNNLGVLYHNAGLHDDAAAAFARAMALDPRMDVARRNFEVACLSSGQAEQRVAALEQQLQRAPENPVAR